MPLAALVLACGCSETPIDALVSQSDGEFLDGDAGAIGAGGDAGEAAGGAGSSPAPCGIGLRTMPWSGTYSIKAIASGSCLHAGPETTLAPPAIAPPDVTVYSLELTATCGTNEWSVVESKLYQGTYIIRSLEVAQHDLDIERASKEDGTRVILYAPVSAPQATHQRFLFVERAPATFAIAPLHAPTQCLTETPAGVQIWPCSSTNDAQEWALVWDSCAATE